MNPIFDEEQKQTIKEEILDKYDIYDILNTFKWELEDIYTELEERILEDIEELDLNSVKAASSEDLFNEEW